MMKTCAFILITALALAHAAAPKNFERAEFIPVLKEPTSPISSHIIAGSPATAGQFPWQAALRLTKATGNFICGGIVVHANWILTAAHCTIGATSILVRLGSLDYNTGGTTYTVTGTANIKTHAGYNPSTLANDVALVKIPTIVPSATIKTIKVLPTTVTTFPGNLTVSGWGRTCDQATTNCNPGKFLNYVHLSHLALAQCQAVYGTTVVTSNTVCTKGYLTGKENICGGDSGGPLIRLGTTNYLVGVVSFGAAAGCELKFPSGYAYANKFCAWMKTTAAGTTICVP